MIREHFPELFEHGSAEHAAALSLAGKTFEFVEFLVKVLRVDDGTGKISLGLKQLQDDPWSTVGTTYEVGQVRSGRVTRVAEFGAFVELEPGIEGLAHASSFPPTGRPNDLAKSVPVGTTATVYRSDSGAVFETPPARPTMLEWALCAVVVAAAVVLAILAVRGMLRLRRA